MVARHTRSFACVLVAVVLAACGERSTPTAHEFLHSDQTASVAATTDLSLLTEVVAATARFHSKEQASQAGYVLGSPCVALPPLGGMGYHWVNNALVDPVFDPLQPEALVYSPGPGGQAQLGAIEYIVIDVGQPAPTFAGRAFDVGGTPVPVPHWSLHVWLYRKNPSGLFQPWNPTVVCD